MRNDAKTELKVAEFVLVGASSGALFASGTAGINQEVRIGSGAGPHVRWCEPADNKGLDCTPRDTGLGVRALVRTGAACSGQEKGSPGPCDGSGLRCAPRVS